MCLYLEKSYIISVSSLSYCVRAYNKHRYINTAYLRCLPFCVCALVHFLESPLIVMNDVDFRDVYL